MRSLLRLLREHEEAVEADLSRWHHLDYRDRWRFDVVLDRHGRRRLRRRLTLRMIAVRVRHLPNASAVHQALGMPRWDRSDYLLADLFHATTGKPHPDRPAPAAAVARVASPERRRKLAAAKRRKAERERAIAAGEIT